MEVIAPFVNEMIFMFCGSNGCSSLRRHRVSRTSRRRLLGRSTEIILLENPAELLMLVIFVIFNAL